MQELKELQPLIIEWAKEKNLNNSEPQFLKILEEVGETAKAILNKNQPEIEDGIGDIGVTIIIFYWQNNANLWVEDLSTPYQGDNNNFIDLLNCVALCRMADSEETYSEVFNYLEDIALNNNTTLEHCLNLAWNEIKNRTGKTLNGTFRKD